MSKIPDEIIQAGILEAEIYAKWLHAGNSKGSLSPHAIDGLADSFSRLILSERQRQPEVRKAALEEAAKIADDHAKSECSGMGSETEAMRLGARSISSAIRALSESSPTLLQEQNANGGKEGE